MGMKLNNKGWGLTSVLLFLLLFFITLIVLVIVGNIISGTSSRDIIESIENANQ